MRRLAKKETERYLEYRGLSVAQLYEKLVDLQAPRPHIRVNINCRDKAERIAAINSEIVLMRGRE